MKALAIGLVAGTALCGVMSVPASAMPMDNLAAAAKAISRWAKARATCAIGIGAGGGRITPTARWATAMDRAITATGQAITAMHQATTATDQAGPAACMAAVYMAGGGGEARNSLLGTAPLAEARGRASGC